MSFQQPLSFEPLYKERVWGGRRLETMLGKQLGTAGPIGESWEIVDREEAQSIVNWGDLRGTPINDLWLGMRELIFGEGLPDSPRFPLLLKILDAKDTLSVQVHPPAHKAAELKGEPKTEMWYLLGTEPGASLYAGFKNGTTREAFEDAMQWGGNAVAELLHKIEVQPGDAMFIPSGRCHAIGGGCLIVEIQQNSDTTYRVFDWGRPRELHVAESLASIDFSDHEPGLASREGELVAGCEHFLVEHWELPVGRADESKEGVIFTVLNGEVMCAGRNFRAGEFFLLPAVAEDRALIPVEPGTALLRTTIPR